MTEKLTHSAIWRAIDRLAERSGFSVSGLARRAGLDATAFNPSKRVSRDGKPRWPGSESLAKILAVTECDFAEFACLAVADGGGKAGVPLLATTFGEAAKLDCFDAEGHPHGAAWDPSCFPGAEQNTAFALELVGQELAPLYGSGTTLIVAPAERGRIGDMVVLQLREGSLAAGRLRRRTASRIELDGIADAAPRVIARRALRWISRIIWASQ